MTASVLTHNGIFTLINPKTNGSRTMRIKTVKNGALAGKRIISLLIGPNNEEDYLGIGFVGNDGIYVWNKHKGTKYEQIVNCLLKIEQMGLICKASTKCRVCNKTLTTKESLELGIGPICAGIV